MGPDKPCKTSTGSESVRTIGKFWVVAEGRTADEGHTSIMTLGYDPQKERFVGSFITSMMSFLWPYEGTLEEGGKVLTLVSQGPSLKDDGNTATYRDVIEIIEDGHRTFTSYVQGEDGEWHEFMAAHYRRSG